MANPVQFVWEYNLNDSGWSRAYPNHKLAAALNTIYDQFAHGDVVRIDVSIGDSKLEYRRMLKVDA